MPSIPPSSNQPYTYLEETGSIRASLQYALDNWKPGQTTLSAPAEAILDRSNTGSFGETHAKELEQIDTTSVHVPDQIQELGSAANPPSSLRTRQGSFNPPLAAGSTYPVINPAALNTEPAPIPSGSPPVAVTVPGPVDTEVTVPVVTPTVAETGIPVSGGPGGPGPSSGSLRDIRPSSLDSSQAISNAGTRVPGEGSSSGPEKWDESAAEEKRRLEREERERLLHADGQSGRPSVPVYGSEHEQTPGDGAPNKQFESNADDEETLPPYQDL